MYNEVDNDMQPFNSIDSEEIFLFSGGKTSIGTTFLQEDDDEHLRHQPNVGASSSPHLQVDVDELLLSSNYIEPTGCDQHDDSLFWNCKDISEDHLNELLQQAQLNISNNSSGSNNGLAQFQPHPPQPNQQQMAVHNSHQLVSINPNDLHHHQHPHELHSQQQIQHLPHQHHQSPLHQTILLPQQQQQPRLQQTHQSQQYQPQHLEQQPQLPQQHPIQVQLLPVVSQPQYIEQPITSTQQSFQAHQPQVQIISPIVEPIDDKTHLASFLQEQASEIIMNGVVKTEPQEKNDVVTTHSTGKKFATTKAKIKEKQTRLDCPYCQRSFCKNFDLQQHMRCHTGEKPFQCIVCGRGFAQKSNVKKHMQAHKVWPEGPNNPVPHIHNSVRSRNNSACSSVGTKDEDYMQENESRTMMDNHNTVLKNGLGLSNNRKNEVVGDNFFVDSKYSCAYCTFHGRTYFELKSHLTVHKREKVFKCIVSSCGKTFAGNDLQSFLEHVKGHKNELTYHCHLCSSQFNSLNEFGQHQKSHNNTQIKKEPNSLANLNHANDVNIRHQSQQVIRTQQQQQIHLQTQHLQIQHQQQMQVQHVPDDQLLNQHQITPQSDIEQQTHLSSNKDQQKDSNNQPSKVGQKYFRCSKCMNRYTTQTALDHHLSISSHHFPCTECDKVFPCERYLRRHLNTHTTNIHVCSFCDKQFKTAAYLKMHSVVHTGEKPFRCNQCDAAFNRRDKLNRHKLTHEPVKKFKCPFKLHIGCTKEFNRPDKLKAHLLTHSGVRPHPCDSCSRTFSRLSRLREHKKLHHSSNSNDNNMVDADKSVSPVEIVCDNDNTIQTVAN